MNSAKTPPSYPYFVMCVDNRSWEGSLLLGKIYQVIRPEKHHTSSWIRVIDEEGEDYLYPSKDFVRIELPPKARRAVSAAAAGS